MEQKVVRVEFPLEFKADDDLIVGYANKSVIDDGGDYIPADAWFDALGRFFREGMPIKLLHRPKLVVGETVWLKLEANGLRLASRPLYPEIRGLIERKFLTAYSIGYLADPAQIEIRSDGGRTINRLDLIEVSYVDDPMNKQCFFGGKAMPLRETHKVHFDPGNGIVTVAGLNRDEMASLAELIKQGLDQAGVADLVGVKGISFKMSDEAPAEDEEMNVKTLLRELWNIVRGKSSAPQTEAEDTMDEKKVETQPVAETPPVEPTPVPAPDMKATLAELEKQVKLAAESTLARDKEIAELKSALSQLVAVVKELVPPATSLTVTDTKSATPEKRGWGLFRS